MITSINGNMTMLSFLMYSALADACRYIIKRAGNLEVYMGNVADTTDKSIWLFIYLKKTDNRQTITHKIT